MIIYLWLLLSHWISDFVYQTDYQAKNKSKSWKALLSHTSIYSLIMMYACLFILNLSISDVFLFGLITFVCHTITDYFTSRLNTKLWTKGDVHNFFVSVGFDQFLHAVQLFATYELLK